MLIGLSRSNPSRSSSPETRARPRSAQAIRFGRAGRHSLMTPGGCLWRRLPKGAAKRCRPDAERCREMQRDAENWPTLTI